MGSGYHFFCQSNVGFCQPSPREFLGWRRQQQQRRQQTTTAAAAAAVWLVHTRHNSLSGCMSILCPPPIATAGTCPFCGTIKFPLDASRLFLACLPKRSHALPWAWRHLLSHAVLPFNVRAAACPPHVAVTRLCPATPRLERPERTRKDLTQGWGT